MKERIPPHNLDMEQSLLSAILITGNEFEDVDLSPGDFYAKKHELVFKAMLELRSEKQPVDLVTVAERLERKGELDTIGGAAYLAHVSETAPVALNMPAYAKGIRDLAVVRSAILSCMKIIDAGYNTTDPEDFISSAQQEIMSLETTGTNDHSVSLDQLCIRAMDRIQASQTGQTAPGLDFGFPVLGKAIHIAGSKLIIIAARPSMGKTGLMLSISKHLACQNIRNTIISIEMDSDELMDRLLSEEADINSLRFYSPGKIGEKGLTDLDRAAGYLSHLPIHIDDGSCRIEDIERKCRKAKKDGSQIIFIDQLSKIAYPRRMSQYDGYTHNCNRIAALKKELRIPVVLLAQLNRDLEKRIDKRPMLSDLKQTGALEEDADIVLFIYRDGYYQKLANPRSEPDQSATEIICAKNRSGATGVENRVLFNAKRGMFHKAGYPCR